MFLRLFENKKICIGAKCYYSCIVILTYKGLRFSRRFSVTPAAERGFRISSLAIDRLTAHTQFHHRHKDKDEIYTSVRHYSALPWYGGTLVSNICESLAEEMYKDFVPANQIKFVSLILQSEIFRGL